MLFSKILRLFYLISKEAVFPEEVYDAFLEFLKPRPCGSGSGGWSAQTGSGARRVVAARGPRGAGAAGDRGPGARGPRRRPSHPRHPAFVHHAQVLSARRFVYYVFHLHKFTEVSATHPCTRAPRSRWPLTDYLLVVVGPPPCVGVLPLELESHALPHAGALRVALAACNRRALRYKGCHSRIQVMTMYVLFKL